VAAGGARRWRPVFDPELIHCRPVSGRRLRTLVCALALSVGVAACSNPVSTSANAENNGVYVATGGVTYQLQVSRELNPYATEDSQYLTGLPAGSPGPTPDELWYGVFLWAKNQSGRAQITADTFDIVDTQGNRYYPLRLNPSLNEYAWTSQTLQPKGIEPGPDTTASFGPTQGGLVLFKLNSSVYSNRPLTLEIFAPGHTVPATISLDL
jgi:hypothetical protein